jgi:hypothetical protein
VNENFIHAAIPVFLFSVIFPTGLKECRPRLLF